MKETVLVAALASLMPGIVICQEAKPLATLTVNAARTACVDNAELILARAEQSASGSGVFFRPVRLPMNSSCSWEVKDLQPGSYDVSLVSSAGVVALGKVATYPGTSTTLSLEPATVYLAGRVLLNDVALPEARITVQSIGSDWVQAEVTSNSQGVFTASMTLAGKYALHLRATNVYQHRVTLEVQRGQNAFEWSVAGGTLHVDVPDGHRPATLQLSNADGLSMLGLQVPPALQTMELKGVPFGTYRLTLESTALVPSKDIWVTIAPGNQVQHVSF